MYRSRTIVEAVFSNRQGTTAWTSAAPAAAINVAAKRSANAVNGVQDRGRYLMPAYGGLYAPLDEAARTAFARRLGPSVEIVPILCGESQRRYGAVHCSVAVFPR